MNRFDLDEAAAEGNLGKVRALLDLGVDADGDGSGRPLYRAALEGHIEVAQLLVERGADIHASDDHALRGAAERGAAKMVEWLLDHGADIHAKNGEALCMATERGRVDVVRILLERGADVHAEGDDPLQRAARSGHVALITLLMEHGADLHAKNEFALRLAANSGHMEAVRILVKKGADIHANHDDALCEAKDENPLKNGQEMLAFLIGVAGPDAPSPYLEYRVQFERHLEQILKQPPAQRQWILFDAEGGVTPIARNLIAAHMGEVLFAPSAWPGEEGRALAQQFYARLREGLPNYRNELDAIDVSAFPSPVPGFCERLGKKQEAGLQTGRR